MDTLSISPLVLAMLFFAVAVAYSSVGLGGGSSYTALLTIFAANYLVIPVVSLTLNLIVTTSGSINFIRRKHARIRLILPFLITSIPMAYIGGTLVLPRELFYWVLLVSLVFVVLRIYFWRNISPTLDISSNRQIALALVSGTLLGLIAGITGIGGGIYLLPLVILLGLGNAREAAACGAIFVWVNSFSGLIARVQHQAIDISQYLPAMVAVLAGGTLGSYMGASKFKTQTMEKILGSILIVAIVLLVRKIFSN